MPISKTLTAPNGAAVTFHKAMQATLRMDANLVSVDVASWSTEADYLAGTGLTWMWPINLAPAALGGMDAALVGVEPFDGGTVVADTALSLDTLKARAWARLRDARNAAIHAGLFATIALPATADDGTAAIPDADVPAMAEALGAWMQANLTAGVALRAACDAATSKEALDALNWMPLSP